MPFSRSMGHFEQSTPQLVSVAEGLGASRIVALFTVVLPLSVPGLLAAAVLVFVLSLGFYVTPILLRRSRFALHGQYDRARHLL